MPNDTPAAWLDRAGLATAWIPAGVAGTAMLVAAAGLALLLTRWCMRGLRRLAAYLDRPFLQALTVRSQGPITAMLVLLALGMTLPLAPFSHATTLAVAQALLFIFVLVVGWNLVTAMTLGAEVYLRRFRLDVEDNLLARKHVTQVRILLRAAQTLLLIVTVSAALMTIPEVRQYGVSLFASAGAAGLLLGLAARPLLSNLLAGIQIAMTQPIRVEDAVVLEGEWGWIENITGTYVVVRLWDLRRLIVPLTYFIEKPFQNWTYESSDLIGTVLLRVDYTVPLDRMREKLQQIVRGTRLWDGKVAVLQVTDTPGDMLELRILVSARGGSATFDLRCEVREKLIGFLQSEYPEALPRQRTEISGSGLSPAGQLAGTTASPAGAAVPPAGSAVPPAERRAA
ncbi:mechanosensitive ion channel family protein [Roseomonas sp. BN140053]|uniref:mechanosensitive ion channel family protein n=1 Tax=Roseomonas sp. BN140053 TaxID=3391898 RepID=UPI0039E77772